MNAQYAYDPLGRRTHKSGTGVTERYFLNDGDDPVLDYDGSKNPVAFTVPGPAIDEPIVMSTPNGTGGYTHQYFHTNHQGSIIATSDDSGAKQGGPYVYDPYGNCFKGSLSCANLGTLPFAFTGQRLDPETGLYYDRARCYSPALGRFCQTDPVGYDADLNLYTYVGNDPTNTTDPYGSAPDQNCTTDSNGTTTCQPVETVVVTAQRPSQPKQDLRSPEQRAGAIALPLPAAGAARAGAAGLGVEAAGPLSLFLLGCGDAPCASPVNQNNSNPPSDATDPNGAKAPGKPGPKEGFKDPKSGPKWGKAPNGKSGWVDDKGRVWVPTGQGGAAHGGPHWDVQKPGGGYDNVYPGGLVRPGT